MNPDAAVWAFWMIAGAIACSVAGAAIAGLPWLVFG